MNVIEISQSLFELTLFFLLVRLTVVFFKQGLHGAQRHKLFFSISALLYSFVVGFDLFLFTTDISNSNQIVNIKDWINITAVIFSLSALGLMIRESKPKIARAPKILAFIPFLILFAYPFVAETFVLKRLVFIMMEAGGILIAILMYSHHYAKDPSYRNILFFISLIALSFLLNVLLAQLVMYSFIIAAIAVYGITKTYKTKLLQY